MTQRIKRVQNAQTRTVSREQYKVGDQVECLALSQCGQQWVNGVVTALFFRLSDNCEVPYQIRLDTGQHAAVPVDDDC